jgi:hypothetical protein
MKCRSSVVALFLQTTRQRLVGITVLQSSSSNSDLPRSESYTCPETLSRTDAADILDTILLPKSSFGSRLRVSGAAGNNHREAVALSCQDPSLQLGYGEFPLGSLDALIDAAIPHCCRRKDSTLNFVDLGSGSGRLCLYTALTGPGWNVHGIEVVEPLHELALAASQTAVQKGMLLGKDDDDTADTHIILGKSKSTLTFLLGPANYYIPILQKADLVFGYSTAWDYSSFSPEIRSVILSDEWNQLLQHCRPGTLVITTDRSCDPSYGWSMLEVVEVDNPEVAGSIGYVQRRV